jgi:hypothetical protein
MGVDSYPLRLGCIVAGLSFLATAFMSVAAASSRDWESLGASSDAALEVFADSPGGSWCQESAAIKIVATDALVFADGAIDDVLLEVAQKLGDQCPRMLGFDVAGFVRGEDKAVYRAIAAREQGWEPMVGKAPALVSVATAAAPAAAAPVAPSGGLTVQQLVTGNTLYGEVLPDALPTRNYRPRRDTSLPKRMVEPTRTTAIYFDQNGTWVERISWSQWNRPREQFLTGNWSTQGDQLCFRADCFQLGMRRDGSIDLIGPDGKHYRRYEGSAPGDAEGLVRARAEYVAKVERSNQALAAFAEIFAYGIMNSGGGGGGSGAMGTCSDPKDMGQEAACRAARW